MKKLSELSGRDRTRFKVRERDNFKCTMCGLCGLAQKRQFHVHHLNGLCGKKSRGYDKVSEMDGLTTLCPRCHLSLHGVREKMRQGHALALNRGKVKVEEFKNLVASGMRRVDIAKHFGVRPQILASYYKKLR